MIGVEAHLVEVGGKAELAVVGGIGSHVDQYIAQSALHLEPLDNGGKALRKRRQGIEQRRERGQVDPVGL
ncbi:hypothetical protein D9M71_328020 [compost metagenome]